MKPPWISKAWPFASVFGVSLAVLVLAACAGGPRPSANPVDNATRLSPTPATTVLLENTQTVRTRSDSDAPAPEAPSDITITVDYAYYHIAGSSAEELRAQMSEFGPTNDSGERHDARTNWSVRWSYPFSREDGGCTPGPIKVTVDTTFVLPQWDVPSNAAEELVDRWNTYMATLQLHENGHKEIAIEAGREILLSMDALPPYTSCGALEQAADALGERILDRFREEEFNYDKTTDHGATQGARFP
jgi:predicted secreted Zn-dependent protease